MNRDRLRSTARLGALSLSLGLAVTASTTPARADVGDHDHLALGRHYIAHLDQFTAPFENIYGGVYSNPSNDPNDDPYIYIGLNSHTHSRTRCGSLIALLLKQAYPELDEGDYEGDVLLHMVGSTSPNAKQWNDAIENEDTHDEPNDGMGNPYGFEHILDVEDIQPGDILAAEYSNSDPSTSGDVSGHVMLVDSIRPKAASEAGGPSLLYTQQYIVTVIDSSSGKHSSDTRLTYGNTGFGKGTLVLYRQFLNGSIYAWTWSVGTSTAYLMVDRPMVAGRLHGPIQGLTPMP